MVIFPVGIREAAAIPNLFLALFEKEPLGKEAFFGLLSDDTRKKLLKFAKEEFRGEDMEIKSLWIGEGKPSFAKPARQVGGASAGKPNRIVLFGFGSRKKWNTRKAPLVSRLFVQYARKMDIQEFAVHLPTFLPKDAKQATSLFATNAVMADFEFSKYKEKPATPRTEVKKIYLAVESDSMAPAKAGVREGMVVGEEVNACRELANTPGSDMTPTLLAAEARKAAKRAGIKCTVLDEPQIKKLGMGGVLGVARGSDEKPRFIILEYRKGPKDQKPLVVAGKGVTFDTGGLNLKPDPHIYEMHMDMSGGAAVIHAMAAIARLKLPLHMVGLIPAVENMPSGSSYRPGDLLKSLSGKTIEVLNTDAEGRVILADALAYGLRYKPEIMMDIATLTGACHVALGNYCSGIFTQDKRLEEQMYDIGQTSGDFLWPLPLWDEYLADIRGVFGDWTNIGRQDRYGGATHGAKFLEQFAGDTRFIHVDIAPKMTTIESEHLSRGASGVGVRLLVEVAKQYPNLLKHESRLR